jgi:tungstate transport system permease protein
VGGINMQAWTQGFLNPDVLQVIMLSLKISTVAVLIGILIGVPIGTFLGLMYFPGRKICIAFVYTFMGLPPVLIGVVVYLLLSKRGLFGPLEWLFTPWAMIIAQVILVTPIVIGLTLTAVFSKERIYAETARSLGASRLQLLWVIIKESRQGIWAGIATAYGRAISEVGAVMLVGGNIEHHTRVMTTAIILETRKGNFEAALALGLTLLVISFIVNSFLLIGMMQTLQGNQREMRR